MSTSRCSLRPMILTDIISINIIIRSRRTIFSLRTTGRAEVPLMRWDHILEGAACSLPVAKNRLIVFCPICELLLTTIHLLHFLCQFPKLKKYHVEIYSTPPHFQRRLPASPWQLPISKDGGACRPCVWREARRDAGGAHMEQWPSKKKKHSARLYVPAVPILIPPLPSSALWWRRRAAITASDCCWAHARLHLTKPDPVKQCLHHHLLII